MNKDTLQITSKTLDAGKSKIIILNGDTIANLNLSKSDTSPSIIINTPFSKFPLLSKYEKNEFSQGVIVPVTFFVVAGFIVFLALKYSMRRFELRHRERMAAIEKGIPLLPDDPRAISMIAEESKTTKPYNPYKWPLILTFVGAAFVIANLIEGDDWGFGLLMIALGAALYYANYLREKRGSR